MTGTSRCRRAPALLALVSLCAMGGQVTEVVIENYTYLPREVHVHTGDSVRWENREKHTSHSILFAAEGGLGTALVRGWRALVEALRPAEVSEPVEIVPGASVPMEVLPWQR